MQKTLSTPRRSQGERTDATRAALVSAARALFEARGFAATGTPEIVAAASVTRGALYHHFTDKTELFHAVARQVAQEVADEIARRSRRPSTPLDALLAGTQAYFAAMAEAGRARLLLLEAPAVLSAEQVLGLSDLAGFQALQEGLQAAFTDGPEALPLRELSVLLSAAFDRAALAIARGEQAAPYEQAVRLLLSSLVRA
ncbi:MAG: TetR/AcrR family transcriptional regulator [Hydrogenophaga sp.]|jgi:AcrR family transcriptional regulator|uniref:TetR/AcrR family transcriptional regulator n=1 Tax=Hydrogenophaga sp. TaxID=1904254 RepID=UPI00260AD26D|nr:TetR family transcriptional regulator [Hydrogenophaga sp.]MCW5668855.1 TetR/AcrR family transcriptional regulator [Hydrogenophaga sp.]